MLKLQITITDRTEQTECIIDFKSIDPELIQNCISNNTIVETLNAFFLNYF